MADMAKPLTSNQETCDRQHSQICNCISGIAKELSQNGKHSPEVLARLEQIQNRKY